MCQLRSVLILMTTKKKQAFAMKDEDQFIYGLNQVDWGSLMNKNVQSFLMTDLQIVICSKWSHNSVN